MKQSTWRFLETVRVILGALIGLGGLRVINSQRWPEPVSLIASVIVGIVIIIVIGYGPKTYQDYCEQQKELN